ncbi:MAG: hypothetical protein ACAI38_15480 [Myxococcota bacterium]
MTFHISQAYALRGNQEAQGAINWRDPLTRQNALDLVRELVGRVESGQLRYIGHGSRGEDAAALQYILNAVGDGDPLVIDGVFGAGNAKLSSERLRDVQRALGERSTPYQARGEPAPQREFEAAGINNFLGLASHLGTSASPLQLGLERPEPRAGERDRLRAGWREQFPTMTRAAGAADAPVGGDDREVDAPDPRLNVPAGPIPIRDEASAVSAIAALPAEDGPAREDVLRRLGIAARASAEGVNNAEVVRGGVAALTAGEPLDATRRIVDFLRANPGIANDDPLLQALRATPVWENSRGVVLSSQFDRTNVTAEAWGILAGPRPQQQGTPEYSQWDMLRTLQVNTVLRDHPDQAVATLTARVNELGPESAASLLARAHGELPATRAQATPTQLARAAAVHEVLRSVFAQDGVDGGDMRRYEFFRALAAQENPVWVTMPREAYDPLMERIYATSTGSWFTRGDRYVKDLRDNINERRRVFNGEPEPYVRGGGFFPLG